MVDPDPGIVDRLRLACMHPNSDPHIYELHPLVELRGSGADARPAIRGTLDVHELIVLCLEHGSPKHVAGYLEHDDASLVDAALAFFEEHPTAVEPHLQALLLLMRSPDDLTHTAPAGAVVRTLMASWAQSRDEVIGPRLSAYDIEM